MTTSQKGRDFIKGFETLQLTAYKATQAEQYWTIGYGHYGPDVKKGQTITREKAEELFNKDLRQFEAEINWLEKNITQNQYDSLVSLAYNIGIDSFSKSTLRKKILQNASDEEITDEFVKWIYQNKKPLNGLKKRRVAEANMFLGKERYKYSEGLIKKVKV